MIILEVSALVNPTELMEKVSRAISNIFSGLELEFIETGSVQHLIGKGGIEHLSILHALFRKEQIIDSVRDKTFVKGLSEDEKAVSFLLNKQAAFVGVASIPAEEEPLGSIEVNIRADSPAELRRLFEWLVPQTQDGVPVFEVDMDYV